MQPAPAPASRRVRLLIIEDDHHYVAFVNALLSKQKEPRFEIHTSESLSQATQMLGVVDPELVLMDLALPDSDGLGTLQAILKIAQGIPVLVLTAGDEDGQGLEAVRMGAQDYLVKQLVSKESLVRCIIYAIERKKNDEFRQRQAAIQDFIETLAHDLSVPMIGSATVIEALLTDPKTPLSREHAVLIEALKNSNTKQLTLVNKLIEVYKYESESEQLVMTVLPINKIIDECLQRVQNAERVSFEFNRERQSPTAYGNREALAQLFYNILDNAAKYSDDKSMVRIETSLGDDEVQISIHNRGERLPAELIAGGFQNFWHSVPGRRYVDRTGLGLYLCHRIVSLHHGRLSCTSAQGVNTVTVSVPTV